MRIVALLITSLLLSSCSKSGGSSAGTKSFSIGSIPSSEGYLVLHNPHDNHRGVRLIEVGNRMMRECLSTTEDKDGKLFCFRSAELESYGTTASSCVGGEYSDAQANEVKLTFCESKDVEGDEVKFQPGTPYAHMTTRYRAAQYTYSSFYSLAFYSDKAAALAAIESKRSSKQAAGGLDQLSEVQSQAMAKNSSTPEDQEADAGDSEPAASSGSAEVEYEPATIKHAPAPRYPPAALRAGITGTVGLSIDLDDHGRVTNVVVKDSSRNRDLDRAAVDAARRWQFNPALENGRPVAKKIWVPVAFGDDGERATIDYVDESAGDGEAEASDTPAEASAASQPSSNQATPSFACVDTGLSPSETAICGSHVLAALDVELAKAYSTKLRSADSASRSSVLQNQRTWLARRDAECGGDVACLQSSLARRLAELQ